MSVHVSSWVWKHSECGGGNELLVMVALADYANDEGVCWPGIKTVAERCRCGESTVHRTIRKAVKRGELELHARWSSNGSADTNLYQFVKYLKDEKREQRGGVKLAGGVVSNWQGVVSKNGGGGVKSDSHYIDEPSEPSFSPTASGKGKMKLPSKEELLAYFAEQSCPQLEVEKFWSHYESNGWKVGKNPMKSWQGAAGGWILRWKEAKVGSTNGNGKHVPQKGEDYRSMGKGSMTDEEMYKKGLLK